jgi:hypothetical protein
MQLASTSPILRATSLRLRLTLRALLAGLLSMVIVGMVSNVNAYAYTTPVSTGNSTFTSAPVYAPHNTALPEISGTAQQGELLSTTNGVWSYTPASYAYQWRDCDAGGANCTDIAGANTSTYIPVAADAGLTLRIKVTATNSGGIATATSAATNVVTISAPVNSVLPVVTGTTQQGETLTATTGAWSLSPTGYTYQWQDCNRAGASCASVAGSGTASTYVPVVSDVGQTLRVVVTATNASGSHSAASLATGLIVGTITNFASGLNAGTNPSATIAGPDGNLWFTDRGTTASIGKVTPTGAITNYSAGLNTGSSPSGITLGSDGNHNSPMSALRATGIGSTNALLSPFK